jgi:transcription elongation factor Elf1
MNRREFQNPGGKSALRRVTKHNPRKYACPTCGRENMLTARDIELGYQCDICADGCSFEDSCCGGV